jgi:hypothetical protein
MVSCSLQLESQRDVLSPVQTLKIAVQSGEIERKSFSPQRVLDFGAL